MAVIDMHPLGAVCTWGQVGGSCAECLTEQVAERTRAHAHTGKYRASHPLYSHACKSHGLSRWHGCLSTRVEYMCRESLPFLGWLVSQVPPDVLSSKAISDLAAQYVTMQG